MTIKPTSARTDFLDFQIQSPTRFGALSKKTDNTAQKKINKGLDCQSSPTSKNNKRTLEPDYYFVPLPSKASYANSRITDAAFPISPSTSPTKMPLKNRSGRREVPPPQFAKISEPKVKSLFAIPNAIDPRGYDCREHEESKPGNFFIPFTLAETANEKKCPPLLYKRSRTNSVFKQQHDALSTGTFKYNVTYLAKGNYSNVYTLEGNENPIIPGVNNSDIVLKAYHGENTGFIETELRNFLHNAIENYRAVKAAGLPVVEIYNANTAEQDGYIIQRKVSGEVDPLNDKQILQVSRFFDISVEQKLPMDLHLQNFVLENEQVLLIDFIEDPDDEIDPFNKKVIENWIGIYRKSGATKDQAADFLNKLTANHYQEFVKEKLAKFS